MTQQEYLDERKRLEERQKQVIDRTQNLEHEKNALVNQLRNLRQLRNGTYVAIVLAFIGIAVAGSIRSLTGTILGFVIESIAVGLATSLRSRERDVREELQDKFFEEELLRSGASPEESRAEELLRMYQIQLRRYYDLNLNQNGWIFGVGILCILLGVTMIAVTIFLIATSREPWQVKTVLAMLGAAGSFMTNYIAAVYLRMNSATTTSLSAFHTTLASTHQLFLANLLIARIEEPKQRWDALGRMSLVIASRIRTAEPRQTRTSKVRKKRG